MHKCLLLLYFAIAFNFCFGQEILYTEKPFNGKGKIKDMQLITHKPSGKIISILGSGNARKITVLRADKQVVADFYYLLSGQNGLSGKAPTQHNYTTLNSRISGLLEFPPVEIWCSGTTLEEVYAEHNNGYVFLSTDLTTGKVTVEEIIAPTKAVILGLVRNEDNYHVLYGIKKSNDMLLFSKRPGESIERKQLTVDLSPLIREGLIDEKERGQLHKFHPAYLLASLGESMPSKPRRSDGFHELEELTQLTTLMVEDRVLNMYIYFIDGLILKVGIHLDNGEAKVFGKKIDFSGLQDKIRNGKNDLAGIDFGEMTQKPSFTYFGCNRDFYQLLHITKEKCLLSLVNRSTYNVEHVYYFDKQGRGFPMPADSAVKPMMYYAGMQTQYVAGIDRFFKILNSASPTAVQFFKQGNQEWFLSIEVDDARLKVGDIAFAAAEFVPFFGLGGASLADAFVRGFTYGAAMSSIEIASAATRKKTTFVVPLQINAEDFSIKGLAPAPIPLDNIRDQLEGLKTVSSITEISRLAIGELNEGRIAKIYDKKTDTIWFILL